MKVQFIRNSGSNVENVYDLNSCVAYNARKPPSFSVKLASESSRRLKYSSCNLAETSTSLCARRVETSLCAMAFLIKARESIVILLIGFHTLFLMLVLRPCTAT